MNLKEWKRKELFHLLTEKFGLKEFQIVGGSIRSDPKIGFDFGDEDLPIPSRSVSGTGDAVAQRAVADIPTASAGTDTEKIQAPKIPTLKDPPKYDFDDDFEATFDVFKAAIAEKESGGSYTIEGVPVNVEGNPKSKYGKGERARGKYQIMPTNWRAWSKAAGLPEKFQDPYAPGAYSPENQEKVADYQFRYYYNKYNTEGAEPDEVWRKMAIAWYGGEGGVRKVERGEGNKPVYHQGTDKPFPSISSYAGDPEEGIIARMNKIRQGK